MGNCLGPKDKDKNPQAIKYRSIAKNQEIKYRASRVFETPEGPNVADMAMRADAEYDIMHRLDTFFCCGNL